MTAPVKMTEQHILDAATDVFIEKGLAGARMQEIADRAKINKAMLHYYYRSKDKLFDIVFEKLAARLFQKLIVSLDNDLPFEEKIHSFYQEHIQFLQKHPKLPAFIFNEINQHPERVANLFEKLGLSSIRKKFSHQLDEEISAGTIRKIDQMQLLINLLALSIFPFAARGLLEKVLEAENIDYNEFIESRKTVCPEFVINAVKLK